MRGNPIRQAALGLAMLACAAPPAPTPVPSVRIRALAARAESARELRFLAPVRAEEVETAGVPALLARELDRLTPPDQMRRDGALAEALGLLPEGTDLRALVLGWEAASVAGFYTPTGGRLYVVQGAAAAGSGEQSAVLVHELGHALQDQHTPLIELTIGLRANDDLLFAIGAFLEGDALWTELRDEAHTFGFPQPSAVEFASRFEMDAPEGESVPRLLRESFLRQYPLGYALAYELVQRGGVAALTASLGDPPLSSEELIHPERYLERSKRQPLALFPEATDGFAPEPGCEPVASTSYGELGLSVWLAEGGLDGAALQRVADGWDGDRAWLLDCPRGAVVAWLVQLDSEVDARELEVVAPRAGWPARAGLAAPAHAERRGRRVLLSSGLEPEGRGFLLDQLEPARYAGLSALLRQHPEILARAAAIRREAQ
jgi:Zn-dependent protease with chaperone function